MKKYIAWFALALVLLPNTLFAYTLIQGKDTLRIENNIDDNLYSAGGKVDVVGNISGDIVLAGGQLMVTGNIGDNAMIAGGNIEMDGAVGGDLIIAWWDIRLKGPVTGDIKAGGGNVVLENSASGDVNIGGGSIRIVKGVTIGRDLGIGGGDIVMNANVQGKTDIFAGSLDLDGTIGRDASISVEDAKKVRIGPNARIGGKLTYKSSERIPALEKIAVGGATYEGVSEFSRTKDAEKALFGFLTAYIIYRFLFLLVIGALLLVLFPTFFGKAAAVVRTSPGKSFLFGLLYFILMPIIAILCFITVIGIPLGFLSLATYVFSFVFAKVLTLVVFTELIMNIWGAKLPSSWQKWGIFLLLTVLLTFVSGVDMIATFFAFGALLLMIGRAFSKDTAGV